MNLSTTSPNELVEVNTSSKSETRAGFYRILALTVWWSVLSMGNVETVILFAGAIIAVWLVFSLKINMGFLPTTWPLLVLCILGSVTGLANDGFTVWDYLRDLIYILKVPIIVIATLTIAARNITFHEIAASIFWASVALSAFYLYKYYIVYDGASLSRRALRIEVGRGYLIAAVGICITIFYKPLFAFNFFIGSFLRFSAVSIMVLAAVNSTSRTFPLIILFIAMGYLIQRIKISFLPVFIVVTAIVVIMTFPQSIDFVGQLVLSWDIEWINFYAYEMLTSSFSSMQEIRASFRAYESARAWELFKTFTWIEALIGRGFATYIDLEVFISLGITADKQELLSKVAVTHISGMTALIKFGWIGLTFFFFAMFPFLSFAKNTDNVFAKSINNGFGLLLAYTILTFQGFFSNLDILNLTIGVLAITKIYLSKPSRISQACG